MPAYEYKCRVCGTTQEVLVTEAKEIAEHQRRDVKVMPCETCKTSAWHDKIPSVPGGRYRFNDTK